MISSQVFGSAQATGCIWASAGSYHILTNAHKGLLLLLLQLLRHATAVGRWTALAMRFCLAAHKGRRQAHGITMRVVESQRVCVGIALSFHTHPRPLVHRPLLLGRPLLLSPAPLLPRPQRHHPAIRQQRKSISEVAVLIVHVWRVGVVGGCAV
jgi:hypothetical protein